MCAAVAESGGPTCGELLMETIQVAGVGQIHVQTMRHDNDCNVWEGVGQCDPPDLSRVCTCYADDDEEEG